MLKICQKCNHANPSATGDDLEACPQCGAIYSRVAAAMSARAQGVTAAPPRAAAPRPARTPASSGSFIDRLRADSLYPTFRDLVRVIYFVWMALAAVALLGAVGALVWGSGAARVGGFLMSLFFTLFFAVIAKVTKEAALMLADLSDAAVHIAARMKP